MAQAKQQATGDSAVVHMAHAGGLGPQPTYAAPKPVGGGAPRRLERAELVQYYFHQMKWAFGHIKEVFDFFANTAEEHRGFCPMLDADTESTITAMKLSNCMIRSGFSNLVTESQPIDAEFKSIIKQWDKTGSGYIGTYTPHPHPPPLRRTVSLATTTEQPNNSHLSVDHGVVLLTVLYRRPREQTSRSSLPRYVLDPTNDYYIC